MTYDLQICCMLWECRPRHWECCTLVSDRRGRDISGEGWDRLRETQSTKDMIKKICISLLMPGCMLYATEVPLTLPGSAGTLTQINKPRVEGNTQENTNLIDYFKGYSTGAYWATNTYSTVGEPTTNEGQWDPTAGSITLCTRPQLNGEVFAIVFGSDTFTVGTTLHSITLSGQFSKVDAAYGMDYYANIGVYDASENRVASYFGADGKNGITGSTSSSSTTNFGFTLENFGTTASGEGVSEDLVWGEGYKLVVSICGPKGSAGGKEYTISDIQVKADVTVPEPTTATLSLLALAGMCGRRRRQKA